MAAPGDGRSGRVPRPSDDRRARASSRSRDGALSGRVGAQPPGAVKVPDSGERAGAGAGAQGKFRTSAEMRAYDPGADFTRESEILPRDLPPLMARGLALLLVVIGVAAAVIASLVSVPETVGCPFVLAPRTGTDPVKAPRRGVVEAVAVDDGAALAAGALLFVIRSDELRALSSERAQLVREIAQGKERLRTLETEEESRRLSDAATLARERAVLLRLEREEEMTRTLDEALEARYRHGLTAARTRIAQCEAELELERKREAIARELRDQAEKALRGGAIAAEQVLRERHTYSEAVRDLERSAHSLADSQTAIATLEVERRRESTERAVAQATRTGQLAEAKATIERIEYDGKAREALARDKAQEVQKSIDQAGIRVAALARELEGAEGDLLQVKAPFDGTVVRIGAARPGAVIERGEVLCELAPAGATLHVELQVPEKDAGKLSIAQPVRLLLTAYPYTRYGTRPARVSWVSPSGSGNAFRTLADLEEDFVMVDGAPRALRAGMGGEARIVTGSRTLVEYAFEPLRQLRENLKLADSVKK